MTTFTDTLHEQLTSDPDLNRRGRRILNLLEETTVTRVQERRKRRKIERLEKTTRGVLNLRGAVDWSKIDWPSVIQTVLSILLKLLPLLIMEEEAAPA